MTNDLHTKTLEIQCNHVSDKITYNVIEHFDLKIKKCAVLLNIARLYDPMSLIGSAIILSKNSSALYHSDLQMI